MREPCVRVAIVTPQKLFCEGLRHVLEKENEVEVVGEATDVTQVLSAIRELKPSVILLELVGPTGLPALSLIRTESPSTKALIICGNLEDEIVFKALKMGAKGYVSKEADSAQLIKAIQAIHRGELWVERKMIAKFFDEEAASYLLEQDEDDPQSELTAREREVLSCLTSGATNKEIGEKLFISEKTVKTHLNAIFRKLRVTKRLQAILYALDLGVHHNTDHSKFHPKAD